jgi:hypothetical protein
MPPVNLKRVQQQNNTIGCGVWHVVTVLLLGHDRNISEMTQTEL